MLIVEKANCSSEPLLACRMRKEIQRLMGVSENNLWDRKVISSS
jgi:hypothetical protein